VSGWTDAHCHLQDAFFGDDPAGELAAVTRRAREAGVERVVVVGTDAATSAAALEVAETIAGPEAFATAGLHPHQAKEDLGPVAALLRRGHPRLVGVGECGLDYFYEHSPRADQRRTFAAQVGLAHELGLALVVHARDAFDDLFAVLASEGVPARTVVHCFTGTPAEAEGCLARGCDVSISGIVTFKNAEALREAAALVPLERLHVETDSPYLAPVPFRGRPNEPAHVAVVGAYLARLRGEDPDALREATAHNTARLFGLPAPAPEGPGHTG
jgi:TatD DNase family protein